MLFRMILIAVSLSIDALGIGVSYELKGIKVSVLPRCFIGLVNAFVMAFSVYAGHKMLEFFPEYISEWVGTAILVLVGCFFIRNAIFGSEETLCDLDGSKDINIFEALLLGFALSADSISIGIAVASMNVSLFLMPICVGITQVLFLTIGREIAKRSGLRQGIDAKRSGLFAGGILIFMGIFRNL